MSNLFDLSGVHAVVTGSSRGIGLAIARVLLEEGAAVVVNGFDVDETTTTTAALNMTYPSARVVGLAGDVTDENVAKALIDAAVSEFGHVNHLICNAGIDVIKPAIDYTVADWDHILAVNLRGAFLPAQAAARHWIDNDQAGSITMTSSIAGAVGIPTLAPYSASKGGINQLVKTLAVEWAMHGIRVNAVAPGYVANVMDGVVAHNDPASDERINSFTPLGRRASADEVAAPYAFLASPAASYVTGSILSVDGGYTAN